MAPTLRELDIQGGRWLGRLHSWVRVLVWVVSGVNWGFQCGIGLCGLCLLMCVDEDCEEVGVSTAEMVVVVLRLE